MICSACVAPKALKCLVEKHGQLLKCAYCHQVGTAVESKFLFDYIYSRVRENIAAENDLSNNELSLIYECGSDDIDVTSYDIVLMEWFNLGDEPYFDDLCDTVPKDFKINGRGVETHFYKDDGLLERNFYEVKWDKFIEDIRHVHRFFNPNAKGFLDSVFRFLTNESGELKPEIIRILDSGAELFRARGAENYKKAKEISLDPASQLGPTPKDKASSQRMTPNGISALYCAFERETCLSEIRSITGDDVVSVAMTPTGTLKLLDLTKLELVEPPSLTLLDIGYLDALHLKIFINSLVNKMSKPKGRNDELSYLSTQVVFEYLRLSFANQVDGLAFPSVQTGGNGTNLVLFPEASVISATPFRRPEEMQAHSIDKPAEAVEPSTRLAIVAGSVRFHKVRAIKTEAETYDSIYELYMSDEVRKRFGKSFQ